MRALAALGISAELNARNDLLIDGRKISGTAQYITKGRMVSHGTLLFSADLSHVSQALHVQAGQISSKAIKSVRSRVVNISEFLNQPMDIEAFRRHLLAHIFPNAVPVPEYPLAAEDWAAVRQLANERYRSWEWTYGHSPDFILEKRQQFACGEIAARLDVRQGVIRSAELRGDVFSEAGAEALEQCLVGIRYKREDILRALQQDVLDRYLPGVDLQTFSQFLS